MKFSHVLDPCEPSASELFLAALCCHLQPQQPSSRIAMSLLNYFKPRDGLPNSRGSLSAVVPSEAIALANKTVEVNVIASYAKHSFVLLHVIIHSVRVNMCYTVQNI